MTRFSLQVLSIQSVDVIHRKFSFKTSSFINPELGRIRYTTNLLLGPLAVCVIDA
jgi:hypothetical protein